MSLIIVERVRETERCRTNSQIDDVWQCDKDIVQTDYKQMPFSPTQQWQQPPDLRANISDCYNTGSTHTSSPHPGANHCRAKIYTFTNVSQTHPSMLRQRQSTLKRKRRKTERKKKKNMKQK